MSVIYQPKGRAREYSEWAANLYRGCGHHCAYCYSASVLRMSREEFNKPQPKKNILERLEQSVQARLKKGQRDQVLLCFTCDPYQPLDESLQITRQAIEILHNAEQKVCILTKGGYRALRDIDLFGEGDAFATTLTLVDIDRSYEWEPMAAHPIERIATLALFHRKGIETWVSLEPVIDPQDTLDLILMTHEFVDKYKVGKINYINKLPQHLREQVQDIDWHKFAVEVKTLLEELDKAHLIKEDLAQYLEAQ